MHRRRFAIPLVVHVSATLHEEAARQEAITYMERVRRSHPAAARPGGFYCLTGDPIAAPTGLGFLVPVAVLVEDVVDPAQAHLVLATHIVRLSREASHLHAQPYHVEIVGEVRDVGVEAPTLQAIADAERAAHASAGTLGRAAAPFHDVDRPWDHHHRHRRSGLE